MFVLAYLQILALIAMESSVAVATNAASYDTQVQAHAPAQADSPTQAQALSPCEQVAARYAHRYHFPGIGRFRPLAMEGRVAPLAVYGAERGAGAAAGALLHAALRHAMRYDAALLRRPYDVCNANFSQFEVAPVAYLRHECESRWPLLRLRLGEGAGGTAWPLLARATHPSCTSRSLARCAFLTLRDFTNLPPVPFCMNRVWQKGTADSMALVVLANAQDSSDTFDELGTLQEHFRSSKFNYSLTIVVLANSSCFHGTIEYLLDTNSSFLFLDKDLKWMNKRNIYFVVEETNVPQGGDTCPASLNIVNITLKVGTGLKMAKYAPQVANVVKNFCPRLEDLKTFINKDFRNENIETAACQWLLKNNDTLESWLRSPREKLALHVFMCAGDPLNEQYEKIINVIDEILKNEFEFSASFEKQKVNCNDDKKMLEVFTKTVQNVTAIGVVSWSSSEGTLDIVKAANSYTMPLVLAGPIAVEPRPGAATAVNGRITDLVRAYKRLLRICKWSRLAILSDGSSYAEHFKYTLLAEGEFTQKEEVISKNIKSNLERLKNDDARIFIVNTNYSIAMEILQIAMQLNITFNAGYAWIVREWSSVENHTTNEKWSSMEYLSLSTAWRGEAGDAGGAGARAGDERLRARLAAEWPGRPWPARAAPLVDAILVLLRSFQVFHRLYSCTTFNASFGQYAIKYAKIYENLNVTGVARKLEYENGFFKNPLVFLEKWQGDNRTLVTSWRTRDLSFENEALMLSRLPQVADRPWCIVSGGGTDFVQRCYDPLLYTLITLLILFPSMFYLVRRARLKRLEKHDRKLIATLSGADQFPTIDSGLLQKHNEIGTGNFGRVYLATLRQSPRKMETVAAKELWNDCDKELFLQEARILALLDHKNIIKLVGVCAENGSLIILMEYAFYGDLLKYLQKRQHLAVKKHLDANDERESAHVSADALTRMAREAASALEYLAEMGLVHRDVRAANCLIDERRTLKLADFGMARKLNHDQQVYTTARHALFPVLCMAPESLNYGTFSTASDVWSLGVLFFELATLGRRPYGDWSPQRVLSFVRLGSHPPLPPDMCSQTRSLMTACWRPAPAARPGAAQLARLLAREPRALRPALLPPPPPLPPPTPPRAPESIVFETN